MKDAPKVSTVVEIDGERWKRVFTIPQASIDTKIDPFSKTQFREKTGNKKGTLGDAWAASAELSEKRAAKNGGVDKVKEKFLSDYKKERRGTSHTHEMARNYKKAQEDFTKGLKKLGFQD